MSWWGEMRQRSAESAQARADRRIEGLRALIDQHAAQREAAFARLQGEIEETFAGLNARLDGIGRELDGLGELLERLPKP